MNNIARLGLPGALFNNEAAIEELGPEHARYIAVVADYAKDGCEVTLWEELAALGFNAEEIEWHELRPGQRLTMGYAVSLTP